MPMIKSPRKLEIVQESLQKLHRNLEQVWYRGTVYQYQYSQATEQGAVKRGYAPLLGTNYM